jgi:hypothetical protein
MRLEIDLMLDTKEAIIDKAVASFLERSMPSSAFILRCLRLCKPKWQHPAVAQCSLRSGQHAVVLVPFHVLHVHA